MGRCGIILRGKHFSFQSFVDKSRPKCQFDFEQVSLVGQTNCKLSVLTSAGRNEAKADTTLLSKYSMKFRTWFLHAAHTKRGQITHNDSIICSFDLKYSRFFRRDYEALSPALSVHNWGLWIWQSRSLATDLSFCPSWWHNLLLPRTARSSFSVSLREKKRRDDTTAWLR